MSEKQIANIGTFIIFFRFCKSKFVLYSNARAKMWTSKKVTQFNFANRYPLFRFALSIEYDFISVNVSNPESKMTRNNILTEDSTTINKDFKVIQNEVTDLKTCMDETFGLLNILSQQIYALLGLNAEGNACIGKYCQILMIKL